MRHERLLLSSAVFLLCTSIAQAAPLTCTEYRNRLQGALLATGAKGLEVTDFKVGFENASYGKRYDWTSNELAGTMNCGPGDQFEEFYASLAFEKRNTFSASLTRFIALSGASICALSSDGATACSDAGRKMLQDGLEQMGRAYNKGARTPSSLVDRDLFKGAKAELTSAPTLVTFLVGPGRGAVLDEARQPLAASATTDPGLKP